MVGAVVSGFASALCPIRGYRLLVRFAIDLSPIGPWGSPRQLAELARLAEGCGWDGVFVEDYVFHAEGLDAYDPWVALAAIAVATEQVRIGTLVTPLPRRRPWKLAAEAVAVDHLSNGRMILGVGSGDPTSPDLTSVGEQADPRVRGRMLDEALAVIDGLWREDDFSFDGDYYQLESVSLRPKPIQQPRIPIWVGGAFTYRRPRERALRWDGSCLYRIQPPDWEDMRPEDVRALRQQRGERFDIAVGGRRRRDDGAAERELVASIAEAGASWWNEWVPPDTPLERVRELIGGGPLRPS
jgi:alkanesulfonate monooxygenase SsuD/methylene tetrahydromethanopterin reductase-like flavin-dependent oxidoreductase (luciferase family)